MKSHLRRALRDQKSVGIAFLNSLGFCLAARDPAVEPTAEELRAIAAERTEEKARVAADQAAAAARRELQALLDDRVRFNCLHSDFLDGKRMTRDETIFLTQKALNLSSSVLQAVSLDAKESLLHWCARHNLVAECAALVDAGLDASAASATGNKPYRLAELQQLRSSLLAASHKAKAELNPPLESAAPARVAAEDVPGVVKLKFDDAPSFRLPSPRKWDFVQ